MKRCGWWTQVRDCRTSQPIYAFQNAVLIWQVIIKLANHQVQSWPLAVPGTFVGIGCDLSRPSHTPGRQVMLWTDRGVTMNQQWLVMLRPWREVLCYFGHLSVVRQSYIKKLNTLSYIMGGFWIMLGTVSLSNHNFVSAACPVFGVPSYPVGSSWNDGPCTECK